MAYQNGFRVALVFGLLTSCGYPPDVEAALGPDPVGTDYPPLLPLGDVVAGLSPDEQAEADAAEALANRVAALNARAAALRRAGTP